VLSADEQKAFDELRRNTEQVGATRPHGKPRWASSSFGGSAC
jgi:hypothetical protein